MRTSRRLPPTAWTRRAGRSEPSGRAGCGPTPVAVVLSMCLASSYARHMDERLLAAARQAQEELVEADHAAEVARAQFHRAVRRLHLSGASLRELAAALHLSHQRVHQIVETAGGGRRWGRRGRLPAGLACSFCG